MKVLVIPFDEAQRMANLIAALPISYSVAKPIMVVLEGAYVDESYKIPEPVKIEQK